MRIIGKKRLTFQNLFDIILPLSTTQRKEKSVMAETAKKAVNYTDELTAKVISDYQEGVDLDTIADEIGKSVRSVRSKLVREGVYIAKPKATSTKRDEPTKKELLNQLESIAPFEVNGFMGATKTALNDLLVHLEAKQ
tara:strand:+ start:562 stop:975 length:414 start_codon:yes stop_codon:yes gene_type:complete